MKIISYNVNSIRARMEILQRWIKENNPDVLCLQETKSQDIDFPKDKIESLGYQVIFKGEKSYNGVAILSKMPFEKVHYGFDGDGKDEGSRLIAAQVNGLSIVNTYIPQGTDPSSEKFIYKLQWFERILKFFNEKFNRDEPLLWLGDFNVAPEPLDVYNPEKLSGSIGFHPDEHRALGKIKEWGFVDIFRKYHPEGGHYTFWDYRVRDAVKNGMGWRVDHIWASRPAAERSLDSFIDINPRLWEKPSDHTCIAAIFK